VARRSARRGGFDSHALPPPQEATPQLVNKRDWEVFYQSTLGRATRPVFDRAMTAWGERPPGRAADLGAGDGTEAIALLERGWTVLAVDAHPSSARLLGQRVAADLAERLTTVTASIDEVELPPLDLVYAGYSLPFLTTDGLARVWAAVRAALRPGGLVAVNLFGPNDTWHTDPTMNFLHRPAVEELLAGLEVLWYEEREDDGEAISGPKHWHVHDLVARRPSGDDAPR